MNLVKFSLFCALAFSGAAYATTEGWRQVTLNDANGYLNCRSEPDVNAPIQDVFYRGEAIFGLANFGPNGDWEIVQRRSNGADNSSCWVKNQYLYSRDADFFKGRIYTGIHRSAVNDRVNGYLTCRRGPGKDFAETSTQYRYGAIFNATRVHFDGNGDSWLFTQNGCYVRGSFDLVQWADIGEDPNSMYNYFTGN